MQRKILFLVVLGTCLSSSLMAQLSLSRRVGKNADQNNLGFGVFASWAFPVNEAGNNWGVVELLDFAMFPPHKENEGDWIGYASIKGGFRHIFSESNTGFYLQPQAGWVRVALGDGSYGNGLALAAEGGYSLGVGQGNNAFTFGFKYETDRAGKEYTLSSVAFRVAFNFSSFKNDNY